MQLEANMKIQNFEIPTALESNSFIQSLWNQSKSKTLSEKQINALKSMLDIEIPLMDYKLKTVKCYKEYFYRADYHGDYLMNSRKIYDIDESKINDIIQDAHALQYGNEAYANKYKFQSEVEIPFNVSNVDYFMTFYYNDFKTLIEKMTKNTFQTIKSRNNAVILLNKMILGDVNTMENIPNYNYIRR